MTIHTNRFNFIFVFLSQFKVRVVIQQLFEVLPINYVFVSDTELECSGSESGNQYLNEGFGMRSLR